ncbi:transcriptional regulator PadR-like family protein [Oxobacter pfennigii]|uniref:Transcriptional regulator PadR-like family protein n=1 Tax=Oxobacter pfennigii TaxID=36849 RepID=A0A0P8Y7K1_9CLOT|nr:helix-turn-helix transcriptional regulator [Oxobacter pfennigii]KPU42466.1 transcriptional regulator PadR-like family protein [Oxobacter pfennigii]
MAREKFQTLTEQMFYILLCLQSECYGMDIMEKVRTMTAGRVSVGPGTLYNLLESFLKAGMICETKVEGRRRSYLITGTGMQALEEEYKRLMTLTADYRQYSASKGGSSDESDKA